MLEEDIEGDAESIRNKNRAGVRQAADILSRYS